jgi:hypothetical protein
VLALAGWLGCGGRDESPSASAGVSPPKMATASTPSPASASRIPEQAILPSATDDRPPAPDAHEEPALVAHATPDATACGALALPPAEFAIDPAPHAKGGWSYAVGDLNGDKRSEIATSSTAYRIVTGDVYAAIHVEEKPGCFRLLGIAFGSIVSGDDALWAWREPGSLLLRARSHHLPPRDEISDYRVVGRRLVLHRTRACFHRRETGTPLCTAWALTGDVPLTRDRELAIPEEVPAASSLTPVPPPRRAAEDLQDERHR